MQVAPEQIPGLGNGPGTESEGQGGGGEQQPQYSQFASEFLKEVPKEALGLLEPYLKKWDGAVTKKFQEIHSQYEPYKNLGEPDQIQQAMQIFRALDEQPEVIFNLLKQELEGQAGAGSQTLPVGGNAGEGDGEEYGQLPPEFLERYERTEGILGQLAELFLQDRNTRQEADEDAQFDSYLSQLKEQHGDFDEDWVTLQISRGQSGEEAVQAWQAKAQEIINAQNGNQRPSPPILGGGGNVPAEQVDLGNIPSGDLKKLVSGMLQQG